jgi:hypothetical protein
MAGSEYRENGWSDFIEVGFSLGGVSANLQFPPSKLYKYTGHFREVPLALPLRDRWGHTLPIWLMETYESFIDMGETAPKYGVDPTPYPRMMALPNVARRPNIQLCHITKWRRQNYNLAQLSSRSLGLPRQAL